MRYARHFNPEWGYVAPAPSVTRMDCLIMVAAIILAAAGAATVFSLLHRPGVNELVAARTLVAPEVSRPVTAGTSVAAHSRLNHRRSNPLMYRAGAFGLPPICQRAGPGHSTVRE